jgi:hypothetical protein
MKLSHPLPCPFGGVVKPPSAGNTCAGLLLACGAIGGSFPCALSLFAACREPVKDRSPSSLSMNGERWYL